MNELLYVLNFKTPLLLEIKVLEVGKEVSEFLERRGSFRAPNGTVLRPGGRLTLGAADGVTGYPISIDGISRGNAAGNQICNIRFGTEVQLDQYAKGIRMALASLVSAKNNQFSPYLVILT